MNTGRYLSYRYFYPNNWADPAAGGHYLTIRKGIPIHLARALKNLRRPNLKRRTRRKWENARDRFRNHYLHPYNDIRLAICEQPMMRETA